MSSSSSTAVGLRRLLPFAVCVLSLVACQSFQGPLPPQPQTPAPSAPPQAPVPEEPPPQRPPPTQPPRQFRLGAASIALVSQAQTQAKSGDTVAAAATLERALRIEPGNPLLWIELGRMRLRENNALQAHGLGRKALALATGDPHAQSAAWTLIADALRAQGRNEEASEAQQRASTLLLPLLDDYDNASPADPQWWEAAGPDEAPGGISV